jgi:hypothetical protein
MAGLSGLIVVSGGPVHLLFAPNVVLALPAGLRAA